MDYAVTAQQMKEIDQNTIHGVGIPSMVLMERAALAVAEAAEHMAAERKILERRPGSWLCAVPEITGRTVWPRDVSCRDADTRQSFCLPEIRNMIQKR